MNTWTVADAALLALRSDVMLAVAAAAVIGAQATGAAVRSRAIQPALDWRAAFVAAAHDETPGVKAPLRRGDWFTAIDTSVANDDRAPQRQARTAGALIAAAFVGLTGSVVLAMTDHAPSPTLVVVLASVAAIMAVLTAVRNSRSAATRSILTRRGVHLLASSAFVEASAAFALLVSVVVVAHTAGLTPISIMEVAAIALATRLAIRITPLPGGIGLADAVFLVPLTWIGVRIDVALAAWLIWRAGSLVAVAAAMGIARYTHPAPPSGDAPATTDGGRVLHRALFGAMSLMPSRIRDQVRRRAFNAMFSLSDDPWGYQQLGYERRKQESLLSEVGSSAGVIVEVGCADGHNLIALARQLPASTVIGSDVSTVAVRIATQRARDFSNVRVIGPEAYDELPESLRGRVDCIVLAEVLYYLGSERAIHDALAPLLRVASADCRVIMLHGSADADRLHDRAARALGLRVAHARRIDDPERPFTLAVAHPSVLRPSPCP
jgi:hypothetical protein